MDQVDPVSGTLIARFPSPAVPGISDVVQVQGGLLFLSGQTALDASGGVPHDFATELDVVFARLVEALRRAGTEARGLARITIYVCDLPSRSLDTIRQVRDRWVDPAAPPASALIGVAALFHPSVRVEVDAIAVAGA